MIDKCLSLSEDQSIVSFIVTGDVTITQPLNKQDLIDAVHTLGAQDFYLYDLDIEAVITAINSGDFLKLNETIIAQRLDTQLSIEIDESELSATMIITGAYGGSHLRGPAIIAALTEHSIIKGVQKEALKSLLLTNRDLKPGESYTATIAIGKAPIPGNNANFLPLVPDVKKRILQPKIQDDGLVDMRDLGDFITVKKGVPLIKRIPATKGADGLTITGKSIPAIPGEEIPLKVYAGSVISEHDCNVLLSSIDGMPIIHKDGVGVDNLLKLKAIDVTTGHISFEGSIFVENDIEAGMRVQATGSITVGGFIENAEVIAHEDISVANGIIGHQPHDDGELSCTIMAKGSISAKLAQHSCLTANKEINLLLLANHCSLNSRTFIAVTDKAGKNGTISGGSVIANHYIKTANLGIEGGAYTKVQAFQNFSVVKENIHQLKKQYLLLNDTIDKIAQINIDKQPSEIAEKILHSKTKTEQELVKVRALLELEEHAFDSGLKQNHIFVTNKMFPRVEIKFNNEHLVTKREYSPSKITFTGYDIDIEPVIKKRVK
uniref:Flagellar Assembly Protein A N-terminal region domain-containing protein n=1 Tax=Aliivibrio wodanis TaxID=80852 RepID=A0A5Q4YZX2_9GAMM|nr:hypothetical protein AW0309160_02933 [Aliivibrio wodanis]